MNPNGHSDENLPNGIGEELGQEAFEHAQIHGEDYCLRERQRIEVANEPATFALRARIALRQAEGDELEERIRNAPPEGDVRTRRNRARSYKTVAAILLVGIFLFTVMALQPFRIGRKVWGLVLAFAIATPFLCDEALEVWDTARHRLGYKVFITVICVAAIGGQILLGVVRGYVFQEQLTNNTAPVVIEGESRTDTVPTFYHKATGCLMLALPLLSLAMELGAAWALWQARKWGAETGEDRNELRNKLYAVRHEQIDLAQELKMQEAMGKEFEHRFRRDFDRKISNRTRNGTLTMLTFVMLMGLVFHPDRSFAADRLNLVMAVDLSGSVASAKGLDGTSELQRNLAAVSSILATAPAGSNITVIGITDQSFSQPLVLLSGRINSDEGYFKERIRVARLQLVAAWKKRCGSLPAPSPRTDVLGVLIVSSQVLRPVPGWRNVLVLFSDMRDTGAVNLNRTLKVPVGPVLRQVEQHMLVADLKGVDVYVLGIDAAKKEPAYWDSLHQFWTEYFKKSGANLQAFSMMREVPDFAY